MMGVFALGIATAFAGYLALYRASLRLSRNELPRIRRLSDQMRRSEVYPFE
ncbi:MAG: hypothetical protein WBY44_33215 [Bryobacteraceae bacterium]|jgi:hypothetical protein